MTLKRRYDEIMDRVEVTDEMRRRILDKLQETEPASRGKCGTGPPAVEGIHGRLHRAAVGVGGPAAPGPGLAQHTLQLADLIAAKEAHAGEVVRPEPELHAQPGGESLRPMQGRGKEAELRPGQSGQAGFDREDGFYRIPSPSKVWLPPV